MYSDPISRDLNSLLFNSTFKHPSESEFTKIKQLISSDHTLNYHHQSQFQPPPPPPPQSSVLRYRSAPSSFPPPLQSSQQQQQQSSLLPQQQPSSHQQQQSTLLRYRSAPSSFFANLVDGTGGDEGNLCDDFLASPVPSSERFFTDESRFPTILKEEERDSFAPAHSQEDYVMYGNNSTSSNIIRQSSSPAGFLASLNAENGIAAMRDVGTPNSSSRLNNQINFSTGPSDSRFMPQIAENGHEIFGIGNLENGHLVNGNGTNRGYDPSTRNDSSFNSLKRDMNGDLKMYSGLNGFDIQNGDSKGYTPSLVHHLSLPKTSSEMEAVEKFLQFQQESVPCKVRAKRGHATHPRSIAERVRRNRISDRMKILTELFPDMDKQANTAEMLDLAVEFIKDLQKEVKTLTDISSRCTCSRTEGLSTSTE